MTLASLTYAPPVRRRARASHHNYELLEAAGELAEQGKHREALAKVIEHVLPGASYDLDKAPLQFIQGSSKITVAIERSGSAGPRSSAEGRSGDQIESSGSAGPRSSAEERSGDPIEGEDIAVTTPLVRLPSGGSAIAALRFVLTKLAGNGQLHQPRLRGDDIHLEFRDKVARMHPAKMLEVLRRMPMAADYYDDWLIGEFKAQPLDRAELEPLSADEVATSTRIWHEHWNEIDELFKEAQRKRSLFFLNELTAYALHRIKFALPLNGFLAAKLVEAANTFNDTNEQPLKRETSLGKCIKDMKAVTDDVLAKELGHATYAISPLADGSPKVISGYFRGGNYIDTIDQYRKSDKAMDAALALVCTYTFLLSRYAWAEAVDAALEDGLARASGKPWREAADVLFHHAKETLVAKFCGDEDEGQDEGDES